MGSAWLPQPGNVHCAGATCDRIGGGERRPRAEPQCAGVQAGTSAPAAGLGARAVGGAEAGAEPTCCDGLFPAVCGLAGRPAAAALYSFSAGVRCSVARSGWGPAEMCTTELLTVKWKGVWTWRREGLQGETLPRSTVVRPREREFVTPVVPAARREMRCGRKMWALFRSFV